jgi:hypothetical protein
MPVFHLVVLLLAGAGLVSLVLGIRALHRRRPLRFTLDVLLGMLLMTTGALLLTLGVATRGYQAFTREAVAARVTVTPQGAQRFVAHFVFPDGREAEFALAGDQLYVDARILKWKPVANFFGLHTAYELDRVAGRYGDLAQEQARPRTVYSLSDSERLNIFRLRQRYAVLAPLLDAEYGSGTFGRVDRPATFEVRVSTTGLLIRGAPHGR